MQFTMLASGSKGNCSLIDDGQSSFLIDGGISPRTLETFLKISGFTSKRIQGLVLTHTHGDHWNPRFLAYCAEKKIPWYLHKSHARSIYNQIPDFKAFYDSGLVHFYTPHTIFETIAGWQWLPLNISHDSEETFGFRLDIKNGKNPDISIGYLADLGVWDKELAGQFAGLDLLALEFNHDEKLQKESKRPPFLIERIMGDQGHLSNDQAVAFLEYLKNMGVDNLPKQLVQIHLSEQCNTPEHARASLKSFLDDVSFFMRVQTAHSKKGTSTINLLQRNLFAFAEHIEDKP
ncbi:MAG: MBL fold metallo-hydrolase [Gemmataceae bacterium]